MPFLIRSIGLYVLNHILRVPARKAVLDPESNSALCSTEQPVPIVTVDATPTSIWSITLAAGKSYRAAGQVITNGYGAWDVAFVIDVDGAGVATARAAPGVLAVGTAGTAALAITLSGLVVAVTGTGVAATNITWLSTIQVTEVGA